LLLVEGVFEHAAMDRQNSTTPTILPALVDLNV
jgi:hypothetical protein